MELAFSLISKAKEKEVELLIPIDSLNADAFSNNANTKLVILTKLKTVGWVSILVKKRKQFTEKQY